MRWIIGLWVGLMAVVAGGREPEAVWLVLPADPTAGMHVHWLTPADAGVATAHVRPAGDGEGWREIGGTTRPMAGNGKPLQHVFIDGLAPDTTYELRVAGDPRTLTFRTLPDNPTRPIRFVDVGDVYRHEPFFRLGLTEVARQDPDFIILGGDIADDHGLPESYPRWERFLDGFHDLARAPDGRVIPVVPVLGNHEVAHGGKLRPRSDVPFFFDLFAYPGEERSYGVIDVGDYFSLVTLDSGHVAEPGGAQRDWLEATLAQRQDVTHLVAAWHVHMFPAKRPFGLPSSEAIREPWLPLFDRFGVDLGLEHHENTYKRTYPIRDGAIDPTGTVFIGNGGFSEIEGRMPEPPGNWSTGGRWYLQKSAYSNYFALVELAGPRMTVEARTPAGHVLDRVAFVSGMHKPVDFAHLGSSFWPTVTIAGVAAAVAFGSALFFVRRRV